MSKPDIAQPLGPPHAAAACVLVEMALVAAGIAVLRQHAPWDAPRFAAFVAIEIAAIVTALTFNFALLPREVERGDGSCGRRTGAGRAARGVTELLERVGSGDRSIGHGGRDGCRGR